MFSYTQQKIEDATSPKYQCPFCGSLNCDLIHNDIFVGLDAILCSDCDEEFTVDPETGIPYD